MAKFNDVWGSGEMRYSGMLAQSIMLIDDFQKALLQAAHMTEAGHLRQIKTEYPLEGEEKLDIYAEFDSGIIGIVNKLGVVLLPEQLRRCEEKLKAVALEKGKGFRLMCVHPSVQQFEGKHKSESVVYWKYSEILQELRKMTRTDSFQASYLNMLIEYLEELEIKPITEEEVNLLARLHQVQSSLEKMKKILEQLREERDGAVEHNFGNYMLFSRKLSADLALYVGFRFGTEWFYSEPLMGEQPECIVFVRGSWDEAPQEVYEKMLKEAEEKLLAARNTDHLHGAINYYKAAKRDSCALAIRKPLRTFVESDAGQMNSWFNDTAKLVEGAIEVPAGGPAPTLV